MIRRIEVENFTMFTRAVVKPSAGLNVVVGDNGSGKSHLLKLAYSVSRVVSDASKATQPWTKDVWQRALAEKLVAVFRPETLGRLVTRQRGRNTCHVKIDLRGQEAPIAFRFSSNSTVEVRLEGPTPSGHEQEVIFIPAQEMLSTLRGFISAYENRELDFDETYYDLAKALSARPLRGRPPATIANLYDRLEDLIRGSVRQEKDGRFRFVASDPGRGAFEMPLVAEGTRKIATLAYLLRVGAITDSAALFWDEPEANLNPKALRNLAELVLDLSRTPTQVLIATHSLFLLREFDLAARRGEVKPAPLFVALAVGDGGASTVSTAGSADEIEPIPSLEADIEQTDRYLDVAYQ